MKCVFKKIILFIVMFIFIFDIKASVFSNYDTAVKNTNNYITKFNLHNLYIDPTDKYLYNGNLSSKSGFTYGGFINTYEFNRTLKNNDSYLITGAKYFTMTDNGNNVDIVNIRNISSANKNDNYESKITEYVRYFIRVKGKGTRSNPWVFESKYTFDLNFEPMGGSVRPVSKKVTILEKYGDLPIPTKTGYDFKGWYFDREYTKEVRSNDIVEITSDTTVYAKWEIRKYNVVMNVTNGSSVPTSMVVNHFNNATFNLTPNNNHEFKNSKITCTNGSIGTITNNVATISNITADTKCSVTASPMYYCPSGSLRYDSSKGYICTTSASRQSGSYSCDPCTKETIHYDSNCSVCGTKNCTDSCQGFTGQNKQDCLDACWICPDCNYGCKSCSRTYTSCSKCPDTYYCPSGWSNYSGSGSNLTCYKSATRK